MYSSAEVIAVLLQRGDGFLKIFFFDEDVVGVVGGYGEDADLMLGEDRRDLGEDPDQRKTKLSDDAKILPPVILPVVLPETSVSGKTSILSSSVALVKQNGCVRSMFT